MLVVVNQVNDDVIDRLFELYSESMESLQSQFDSREAMKASYGSFLSDFITDTHHLVLAEEVNGLWVSGLRVIETACGKWFIEAVETMPAERKKGYGKELLLHTLDYLNSIGMAEVACTIAKTNVRSMGLHEKCGFKPTADTPINPWGEIEEETTLYRFTK